MFTTQTLEVHPPKIKMGLVESCQVSTWKCHFQPHLGRCHLSYVTGVLLLVGLDADCQRFRGSSQTADSQLDTSYGASPRGNHSGTQARRTRRHAPRDRPGSEVRARRPSPPGRATSGLNAQPVKPRSPWLWLWPRRSRCSARPGVSSKTDSWAGPVPGARTGNGPAASRHQTPACSSTAASDPASPG